MTAIGFKRIGIMLKSQAWIETKSIVHGTEKHNFYMPTGNISNRFFNGYFF